jgi:hypothetical protein
MSEHDGETLHELIRTLKGRRSFASLADMSGDAISLHRWNALGSPKDPDGSAITDVEIDTIGLVLGVDTDRVRFAAEQQGWQLEAGTRKSPTAETFAELVRDRKGNRSYSELVADAGHQIKVSRWQDYGSGRPLGGAPSSENIRAIALGLRVPEERVWLALGRTLGHYKGEGRTRLQQDLNPESDILTRSQENAVREFVDELVAARKAALGLSQAEELGAAVKRAQKAEAQAAKALERVAELESELEQRLTQPTPLRRAARRTTGTEGRGPRGGANKK